jgi:Amidases related to nicotinamidase
MQALLIIDVQNDYFECGKNELCNPMGALGNIEKVLAVFRQKKLPVIHVQHINLSEGATFFLPNTKGVLIHKDLTPIDGECHVTKHAPNSFFETNLLDILKKSNINDLVICGMMTHMCVDTTTRACKDFGLKVTLLSDACATKNLSFNGVMIPAGIVHNTFMAALSGTFADVMETERYLHKTDCWLKE